MGVSKVYDAYLLYILYMKTYISSEEISIQNVSFSLPSGVEIRIMHKIMSSESFINVKIDWELIKYLQPGLDEDHVFVMVLFWFLIPDSDFFLICDCGII